MKKFFKLAGGITGASLLLWYGNYERTHTDLDTTLIPVTTNSNNEKSKKDTTKQTATLVQGENGKLYEVRYSHPDNNTTLALDYLGGKAELSVEKLFDILKGTAMKNWLRDMNIPYPDNADAWSMEAWSAHLQKNHEDLRNYDFRSSLDSMWIDRKLELNPSFYEAWWSLEQECGNPKISLTFEPTFMGISTEGSYYHPGENTIYLSLDELYKTQQPDNILKTFAYAKYFNDHPLKTQLSALADGTVYGFKNKWDIDSMSENFSTDFAKEMETFEKEVTTQVLPELKTKYPDIAALFTYIKGDHNFVIPNIAFVPDQAKKEKMEEKRKAEEEEKELKDIEAY